MEDILKGQIDRTYIKQRFEIAEWANGLKAFHGLDFGTGDRCNGESEISRDERENDEIVERDMDLVGDATAYDAYKGLSFLLFYHLLLIWTHRMLECYGVV